MAVVYGRPLGLPGNPAGLAHLCTAATSFEVQAKRCRLHNYGITLMIKPTPNPPQNEATSPYESLDSKKLHEAAERALNHHFAPPPGDKPKPRKGNLFTVSPDIDTEALLANASEDLLSISAIAANLADDVDGARRSLALALSRLADGVRLLVERALDHIDSPNPAEHRAKV